MINTITLPPFKKMCVTIGNLPTSFVESMSYYEALCWMYNYLDKTVIPAINTEGEAITELQAAFTTLKTYVDNYFENLDVQEEINNKLDAMAEAGTLADIIAQYLGLAGVLAFSTVADMKSAENLVNGSTAKTLGYYSVNDGGCGNYKIRTITNDDVVDEGSIIALHDNTLVAELVPTDYVSIYQFGAKGDGETDDTTAIQNAINYAKNHNYMVVKGTINKVSVISNTLKLHAYSKIDTLYLDVKSGHTLTNNYMISINSDNVSTWDIAYPNATKGFMKNIDLQNSNSIAGVNGILNGGNIYFENIQTNKLNISLKNINSYLDVVQIHNIQVAGKIGTDYAIQLGTLGDACKIDTAHMYGATGTANFIETGNGHNALLLKNIIANGNVNINGGNTSIENLHSEAGKITINDAIVNISNGYLYHNDPNIEITNSYVILNQLQFVYDTINRDFTNANDIDINITNSNVEINECYKSLLAGSVNDKIFSFVKTNLDDQPSINPNKKYYRTDNKANNIKCSYISKPRSVAYPQLSEKVKWSIESGTYYYKAYPIADVTRNIKTAWYDGSGNVTMTNGDKGFRFASASNGLWRVYRGTSDGVYDKYVDIAICGGSIQDSGLFCNGYKWINRTAGAVDSFENITNDSTIEYVENNIRCYKSGIPTTGTWTKGDIVYKASVGENDPIGWICIESGTPGTWKAI